MANIEASLWRSLDKSEELLDDDEDSRQFQMQVQTDVLARTSEAPDYTGMPLTQSSLSERSKAGPSTTPDIPSPINTPSRRSSGTDGLGRRDDPSTPLPLGEATYSLLRQKKDFQTMSKHFEVFEKGLARTLTRAQSVTKGKGKQAAVPLVGCRICLPLDAKGGNKHKDRWSIVGRKKDIADLDLSIRGNGRHSA